MDEPGPIYRGARSRLVSLLEQLDDQLLKLLAEARKLAKADSVPEEQTFRDFGTRFNQAVAVLPNLNQPLRDSSELDENAGRRIASLRATVEQARTDADILDGAPIPTGDLPAMTMAARKTAGTLRAARKEIRDLLLPYRLKCKLHELRPGKFVDFKKEYGKQLRTVDDRVSTLKDFETRTEYFAEGVFDIPGERVWRRSASVWWRLATCLAVPVFALLVGGGFAAASLLPLETVHLDDAGDVLAAYGLVLGGAVANLVVENIKQAQAKTVPIIAIGELVDWLHLRWGGLLLSFAPIVIVVIGLLASGIEVSSEEAILFFFAGYSADSVAGTFLTRFGTAKGPQVREVLRRIGGADA